MKMKPLLAILALPLAISSAYAEDSSGFPAITVSDLVLPP